MRIYGKIIVKSRFEEVNIVVTGKESSWNPSVLQGSSFGKKLSEWNLLPTEGIRRK